jgi:hypothetical protein
MFSLRRALVQIKFNIFFNLGFYFIYILETPLFEGTVTEKNLRLSQLLLFCTLMPVTIRPSVVALIQILIRIRTLRFTHVGKSEFFITIIHSSARCPFQFFIFFVSVTFVKIFNICFSILKFSRKKYNLILKLVEWIRIRQNDADQTGS